MSWKFRKTIFPTVEFDRFDIRINNSKQQKVRSYIYDISHIRLLFFGYQAKHSETIRLPAPVLRKVDCSKTMYTTKFFLLLLYIQFSFGGKVKCKLGTTCFQFCVYMHVVNILIYARSPSINSVQIFLHLKCF